MLVQRSAPAIIPAYFFDLFQFPAVSFGRSTLLYAEGGFSGQAPLDACFFSQGEALSSFLVEGLRYRRRSALITQGQNLEGSNNVTLPGADHVANFDFSRSLGCLAIDFDPAFANFICCQ